MRISLLLLATALPSLALGATFDRLSFEVPPGWRSEAVGAGAKRHWTIAPVSTLALVRVYHSFPRGERTLAQWSDQLVEQIDQGRKQVKLAPARPRTSKVGVAQVARVHVSQDARGLRRFGALWVFDAGGDHVQAVSLLALDPRVFVDLSTQLERTLDAANLVRPPSAGGAVPKASEPPPAAGGTNEFHDQGVIGSTSVVSVPKSARLAAIPFEVTWAQPYGTSGSSASSLDFGVDPAGSVYLLKTGKLVNTWQRDEKEVWRFKQRKTLEATGAGKEAIERYLNATQKPAPERGWRLMQLDRFYVDAKGHGFLRASLYSVDCDAYLAWWEGKPELVAHPGWIAGVAKDLGVRSGFVEEKLVPAPDGSAWLFVNDGFKKSTPGQLHVAIRWLERTTDKGWQARVVAPRFERRGTKLALPTREDLLAGSPDWRGGWVCYTGTALWRLERSGKAYPLAEFRLRSKAVRIPSLLVQPSGDVWFAVNRRLDVTGHVDTLNETHLFVLIGDRSRWVRVRLGKEGRVQLGEISAEALLSAIKRRTPGRKDSTVVETTKLRWDPSAPGGIVAYDGHHDVLYTVRPKD